MKTATKNQTKTEAASNSPSSNRLLSMRTNGYSLLGLRDYENESKIQDDLPGTRQSLSTPPLPKLYTLVSQNRKISFSEKLSTEVRIFLNFESFKWSELYFNFFHHITTVETQKFVFERVLYKLETHLAIYHSLILKIMSVNGLQDTNDPIHRIKLQSQLTSYLVGRENNAEVFFLYICDLVLICLGKKQFAQCAPFVEEQEAAIILNHMMARDLIHNVGNKWKFDHHNLKASMKDYIQFRGRFVLSEISSERLDTNLWSKWRKKFNQIEANLLRKKFETCFHHI